MAARRTALTLSDEWRTRIKTSMLINALNDHIFNGKKMEPTQLKAIEILLKKVAPDLSQVDGNLNVNVQPKAMVYPLGIDEQQPRLPAPPETVDSVH